MKTLFLLLSLLGVSAWVIAGEVAPITDAMRSMKVDYQCLEDPEHYPWLCATQKPADLVADFLLQAQTLEAHAEWVTALAKDASVGEVQSICHQLVAEIVELQVGMAKGDSAAIQASLSKIEKIKSDAHEKYYPARR
jgi:histidine ammonia-lyase